MLSDIDTIAARYGLVPGPDLYAEFRLNLETDNGSFFGEDGTHHVDVGGQRLVNAWAEAFVNAFEIQAETESVAATATAVAVSATETAIALTPTSEPTETPTPEPTLEAGVEDEMTRVDGERISAENARPLWQAFTLFGIVLVISLGIILTIFKRLKFL